MAGRPLTVTITGDARDVQRAFKDTETASESFGSKMESLGSKLMGFGTRMTLGVTLPLALLGKASFDAASDLNESMSKVDQVFDSSAGVIHRWSKTSADSFGMSRNAAEGAAGTFGNMFVQLGFGGEQAAGLSMKMVELAGDFASFHNADITEVIEAQSAAFRGEYDALQKFVPTISAAAVEQKALATTGKESADQLTAGEKAAAVYALMMEGAGDALGDYDRTADGAANKQRELNAKFEDAKAKIGDALIPIFLGLATALEKAADWFSKLSPGMQKFVVFAGLALAAIGPLATVLGGAVTIIGVFSAGVAAVALAIGILIGFAVLLYVKWDEVWSAVANNPWLLAILAPLGAILLPIIALVGIIKLLQDNWDVIWPAIQSVAQTVWGVLQPVLDAGASVVRAIGAAAVWLWERWQEAWPVIQSILEAAWDVIGQILYAAGGAVDGIRAAIDFLKDVWNEAWPIIQAAIDVAWQAMQPWLNALKAVMDGIIGAAMWVKDNAGAAWDGFKSGVETMWGAVQGPLGALLSLLDRIVGAAQAVKRAIEAIPGVPNVGPGNLDPGNYLERGVRDAAGGASTGNMGNGVRLRAAGGPVDANALYMVGEKGPELFSPSRSGMIIPNHALGGNNYSISVQVAPGGSPAETGRAIVEAIRSYENASGATWRAA